MPSFIPFSGRIIEITDFGEMNISQVGCNKLVSVEGSDENIVNFVVTPSTYFVDHVMVKKGDNVTGFYDGNAPVPLIFPPQLRAVVMAKDTEGQNVKVDYFDKNLISSDNQLKLNIDASTQRLLENGQSFNGVLENRNLIVLYGPSTRSIPAQTTPYKVVVMCNSI